MFPEKHVEVGTGDKADVAGRFDSYSGNFRIAPYPLSRFVPGAEDFRQTIQVSEKP
jgi:hypothetical protein